MRTVVEVVAQCASCDAPLADDQRYCLECGERRASIGSAHTQSSHGADAHTQSQPRTSQTPTPTPPQPPHPTSAEHGSGPNGTTAVISGVGVLLLAMGVGVLIGRTGNPTQTAQQTPQVITLSAPATSSQQSPGANNATTPSTRQAPKAAKHPGGSRVGSSVKHPAPASVLEGLKGAKGKSYEEKSKNLPDVVSTG